MADKSILFFSHSSRDARAIARLKNLFLKATGGSVEVFLSTDGQSIPLGRNWVHRIEDALEHAGLMVVFVSPSSLRSSWIFFESGFAYAKKIRVVPVGFLGVDLAALSPPLSLLQGFNITSEEGLNNIIAVSNEVFTHSHTPCFSAEDYRDVCGVGVSPSTTVLGNYGTLVDSINAAMTESELACSPEETLSFAMKLLDREGTEYTRGNHVLDLYGISFSESGSIPRSINLQVDPGVADNAFAILSKVFSELRKDGIRGSKINFYFVQTVQCVEERYKVTGKIYGTDVKMAENRELIRGDISFAFGHLIGRRYDHLEGGAAYLSMKFLGTTLPIDRIRSLLEFLFDQGLFFLAPEGI